MKTAIQWLKEQYIERGETLPLGVFEEAKEMEIKQLIKAHIDGFDHIVAEFKKQEYAEQYFNQTFKNQTNEPN
jgi:hypothetical protein